MAEMARRLRERLAGSHMLVAPFVYDCVQARIAEKAGFEAVYMTGFGTAAARGFPDLGLLTMSEMVENVRAIARSVGVPLICDGDTGYGDPINVWRTVREYEDAGAAALHIEDQLWPKKCGFLAGKRVIPVEEMIAKVRVACEARRDSNFVIIARTDALAVNGWDDAARRADAYHEAGADLIFVDGIRTLEELRTYAGRLGHLPLVYNGALLPVEELARCGFKVTIHIGTLLAHYRKLSDAMRELKETGTIQVRDGASVINEMAELMGAAEIEMLAEKYSR